MSEFLLLFIVHYSIRIGKRSDYIADVLIYVCGYMKQFGKACLHLN